MSNGDTHPLTGPGSQRRRRGFLITSGVLMLALVVAFRGVLMPFVMAVVLAYVLSPLVDAGQRLRLRERQPPRWIVVLLIYTALVGSLSLFVWLSVPRLTAEFTRLAQETPHAVAVVRDEWIPELERRMRRAQDFYASGQPAPMAETAAPVAPGAATAPEATEDIVAPDVTTHAAMQEDPEAVAVRIRPRDDGSLDVVLPHDGLRIVPDGEGAFRLLANVNEEQQESDLTETLMASAEKTLENSEASAAAVIKWTQRVLGTLTRGVFGFVMMLMLSAYMLITKDAIMAFFRSLYTPGKMDNFDDLVERLDRGLAGVVRGQLMICVVNGVLSGIGFYFLDLRYWTFMTIVATVMSIIPIFGAILSSVPAVAVAMPDGMGKALLVLAWIVLVHQIEANLLNPKIMGDSARVHPVLVVFALLAGEHVAGIAGALLAVPVLSITQTLFLYLRERYLGIPRFASEPPPPPTPTESPPEPTSVGERPEPT